MCINRNAFLNSRIVFYSDELWENCSGCKRFYFGFWSTYGCPVRELRSRTRSASILTRYLQWRRSTIKRLDPFMRADAWNNVIFIWMWVTELIDTIALRWCEIATHFEDHQFTVWARTLWLLWILTRFGGWCNTHCRYLEQHPSSMQSRD